jgi:hypothetical protein
VREVSEWEWPWEPLPPWSERDLSPEECEAVRVAGGFKEMTPEEVKEHASAEVKRRLEAFDAVWEFVIGHDTSASANGHDVLSVSVEGEWYEQGARETLEYIRSLLSGAKS